MGCKFSKTNKVLPVVEPTHVKPATLPPTSSKAKKGLIKGRSGKKTPFVAWDAPTAANNAAFFAIVTKDTASPAASPAAEHDGHPSPRAESTQATESLNQHPLDGKQRSVDYAPIRLVKEADICNREVTPSTVPETPGTLIKRCSQGSIKIDPLISGVSGDSGIGLAAGENDEYAKVITEMSSPEKQEIAKVPDTATPDLAIQGVYIQPPYRPSQIGKLSGITARRPLSGRPPLPHLLQRPHPPLQAPEDDKHDKVKLLSIVERPSSRGGMAFDINFDDNSGNKKMPKLLQKKVKFTNLTKEELQAKLDAAEQRRKAREEEKQEKIRAKLEHDRQVMNALEAFQKAQMAKTEEKLNKKMAANEENREQHFRELKSRLKEKSDRMMAALEAKKVKPLRPPIVKEQSN